MRQSEQFLLDLKKQDSDRVYSSDLVQQLKSSKKLSIDPQIDLRVSQSEHQSSLKSDPKVPLK